MPDNFTANAAGGMGYSTLAKQWFRNPLAMATSRYHAVAVSDGAVDRFRQQFLITAQAYLVSPTGAPAPYGYLAPVTVRSVGFGLMPVEATIQVSQRRKDGYPIPFRAQLHALWIYSEPSMEPLAIEMAPVVVDDALNVDVLQVKIDGQSIGLLPGCKTTTPAPVHLVGPGYTVDTPNDEQGWFRSHDPKTFFHPMYGGYMAGSITIPPFTGCRTSTGDDISALMTASASGPGNPVETTASWPCGYTLPLVLGQKWPLETGKNTPKKAGCEEPVMDFPYPSRPAG